MSNSSVVTVLCIFLISCSADKNTEKLSTPRIKKETKITSPTQNQKLTLGDKIPFDIQAKDTPVDSVLIEYNGENFLFYDSQFDLEIDAKKVGSRRIKTTVFIGDKAETHYMKLIFLADTAPLEYAYEVINTYPHSKEDYTQGLLISDGFLYESTGRNGHSTLKKKDLESGKTLEQVNLADDFFGEGLALINDQFYQLTYTSGTCFVYNRQFERINSFNYEGEGWGLCELNGNLLMTNQSEKMVVRDPRNFSIIDEIEVYDHVGKVNAVNELEAIDGLIYANVYVEDFIVAIDPNSGAVVQKIDMSGLLDASEAQGVDVLNGIAYDKENDRLFVTGKLWSKLFEIKFIPKHQAQ